MDRPRWVDLHRLCPPCLRLAHYVRRKHCEQDPTPFRVHEGRRMRSVMTRGDDPMQEVTITTTLERLCLGASERDDFEPSAFARVSLASLASLAMYPRFSIYCNQMIRGGK